VLSEAAFVLAFAGSHVLAKPIGAWPSVAVVAVATTAVTYALTKPKGASSTQLKLA
jgi:hypothetical protein